MFPLIKQDRPVMRLLLNQQSVQYHSTSFSIIQHHSERERLTSDNWQLMTDEEPKFRFEDRQTEIRQSDLLGSFHEPKKIFFKSKFKPKSQNQVPIQNPKTEERNWDWGWHIMILQATIPPPNHLPWPCQAHECDIHWTSIIKPWSKVRPL